MCIVAALAAQVVVPAMHAIVHGIEVAVSRAHASRWRVEGRREGAPERAHEHHHDHSHDGHDGHGHRHDRRGRHEHPGDRPGEHGARAPEHLTALIVGTPPVVVPPNFAVVAYRQTITRSGSVVPAPSPSCNHNRGPPRVA